MPNSLPRKSMTIKFAHVNIVSKNIQALAKFYQDAFECIPIFQPREISGSWVDQGTGLKNARLKTIQLKLPCCDKDSPALEIFEYDSTKEKQSPLANQLGLRHIAFLVDDVEAVRQRVLNFGGSDLGKITERDISGIGRLIFVYMKDPEGNIVEILKWNKITD